MEIEHKIDSNLTVRASSEPSVRTFPVDVEHGGIRIALPVIMIAGGIALYVLLSSQILVLVPDRGAGVIGRQLVTALEYQMPDMPFDPGSAPFLRDANGIIGFVVGLLGALLIGAIADRLLKRFWPSGRTLTLEDGTLRLRNVRGTPSEVVVTLDRRVNVTSWQFTVRRSSPRAQRGWHMLAYQLLQDDSQIVVYSFMTPKAFAALPDADRFVELKSEPAPRPGRQNANVQSLRTNSEQKRIAAVDAIRLEIGAELRPADFGVVLGLVMPLLERRPTTVAPSAPVTSLRKD